MRSLLLAGKHVIQTLENKIQILLYFNCLDWGKINRALIDNITYLDSTQSFLFLQYLENTPKNAALVESFHNLVREKLVSHMKNTVSLG